MKNKKSIQRYVLGFIYSRDTYVVVLQKKARPRWQRDKLNGIGGAINPGEEPHEAMDREFREKVDIHRIREIGEITQPDPDPHAHCVSWIFFNRIAIRSSPALSSDIEIYCYVSRIQPGYILRDLISKDPAQPIDNRYVMDVLNMETNETVDDLGWLLLMGQWCLRTPHTLSTTISGNGIPPA